MSKKLKIKFWRTERALVMQVVEQEGLPEHKVDGFVNIVTIPVIYKDTIYLRGDCHRGDFNISGVSFKTNADRDANLNKITQSITDELFTGTGKLKVGDMCMMSDNDFFWEKRIFAGKSAKQLGLEKRFLAVSNNNNFLTRFAYAKPLPKRTEPKVEENGEIITYTWEVE